MKKIISILAAIAILTSMVACASKPASSDNDNSSAQVPDSSQVQPVQSENPQPTEQPTQSPAPTAEPTPQPTPVATVRPTQRPEESEPPQVSATVVPAYNVNFKIKIIGSTTDDMTIYQDVTSPYDYQIAITDDSNAINFSYCSVDATLDDNGKIIVNDIRELYSISVFSDVTTFTTNVQFPEILPNRAVKYTDGQGTHMLFIAQSGADGSAIFIKG